MFRRGKSKYNAKRTADGFHSQLEASVYQMLLLREKAKEIRDIRRQVRVELTRAAIATKIDFSFEEVHTGNTVFCEAKGMATERWNLLKKLWAFYGPGKLEIFGGSHQRPRLIDVIEPEQV